jgi:hypothetical protein
MSRFSLVQGGLVFEVERLLRLRAGKHDVFRRSVALAVVGWLPPVVLAIALRAMHATLLAVHMRFLVAIPLFLWAEGFVDGRVGAAVHEFGGVGLVKSADQERYRAVVATCGRLRESSVAVAAIVLLAFGLSFFKLGDQPWRRTPVSYWIAYVSLPLFRIVLGLWLWRWLTWVVFLARAARFDLQLVPTHPDRAGGLGFVQPAAVSFALIHVGMSVVIAAGLVGRVVLEGGSLAQFGQLIVAFGAVVFAMVAGPLLFFVGHLVRAKQDGRLRYGAFAQRHNQLFADRWIRSGDGNPLGEAAISSLADLGTSFSYVENMRAIPLDKHSLLLLAVVSVSPVIPLLPVQLKIEEVLKRAIEGLLL